MNNNSETITSSKISNYTYLRPSMILLLVFVPFAVGFFSGGKYLLPFFTGIPAGIVLILHLRRMEIFKAAIDMILYVLWLTIIGLALMYFFNDQAEKVVLQGTEYWDEMVPWLSGEVAKEGTPSLFIPEHLLHMGIVAVASLLSAGMIALLFGTVLINYMNFYVSKLMLASNSPALLAFIGWHPWSICRVIGFIVLGCAFAWPLVAKLSKNCEFNRMKFVRLIIIAVILELLDIILKTSIGPTWRGLITSFITLQN